MYPAWFKELRERLAPICHSPQQAHTEALWLVEHCLGLTATALLRSPSLPQGEGAVLLQSLLHQRITQRKPLQHLVGYGWFYGRKFTVSPAVLIPRPETEGLVELALAELATRQAPLVVADAGTGSGCILLSLLLSPSPFGRGQGEGHSLPYSEGKGVVWYGLDASPEALVVAQVNAQTHLSPQQQATVQWLHSDWLAQVPRPIDVLVSNPPYIPPQHATTLAPEVANREPATALFADDTEGLSAAKALLSQTQHLAHGAWVGLELGDDQPPLLATWLVTAKLGYTNIACHKDTAGVWRYITARFTP
jgi:release factor glutamine methyltransferase